MFKKLVQMGVQKLIQSTPRSQKVGPTIKSVKPNLKKTVKETKSDEYVKRIRELEGAEKKIKSGKEMMKEGQRARKKMIDTKRAFQFKHGKSTHAIKPGDKPEVKYKGNVREQKMGGGMMGRRFGMKKGSKFPDLTGDGKVTFADILKGRGVINGKRDKKAVGGMIVKLGKAGKKFLKSKEGKEKLKEMDSKKGKEFTQKMLKKLKDAGFKGGGSTMSKVPSDKTKAEIKKYEKRAKAASEFIKNKGRSFGSRMREKYMR